MVENLIFFFSRVGTHKNAKIIDTFIKKVQDERMVEKGEVRDHVMLMQVINQYKFDVP
jgi:hypothetical protein